MATIYFYPENTPIDSDGGTVTKQYIDCTHGRNTLFKTGLFFAFAPRA
ncbi:hypothetical protein PAUR_a2629 [Pseudoalteromonas aurantia 208]|uniref:Uncharacterized protein n=1 Tax=Pseudoalteromonas aurantia 208 TaxID=1314867 RepID=A0ABR9ED42_9GAMM|nr:hypothetical protein [Pseudoalteromonas aurantia 208]